MLARSFILMSLACEPLYLGPGSTMLQQLEDLPLCVGTFLSLKVLQISLDMYHPGHKRLSLALREATARCTTGNIFCLRVMHV